MGVHSQISRFGSVNNAATSNAGTLKLRNVDDERVIEDLRQEVAAVVCSSPFNGIPPASFCRLSDDTVVNLEWEVCLSFKGSNSLAGSSVYIWTDMWRT